MTRAEEMTRLLKEEQQLGADREREEIVRWLRLQLVGGYHIVPIAEAIERGEHLK